jgi:NADPH-dependent 7-cyano-7-deazaguanine reductase QueF-like protein
MSFTYSFGSPSAFISVNPWFDLYLDNEVRAQVERQFEKKFPSMFREHAVNDNSFTYLKNQLNDHTSTCISRISSEASRGVSTINAALDTKMKTFIDSKDFTPYRNSLQTQLLDRYSQFESRLRSDFETFEKERNKRVEDLHKEVADVKSRQWVATVTSGLFGLGIGLFVSKL